MAHIFEHAEWGIAVTSPDGKTLEMMNPAFAALHGYLPEELQGRFCRILFAPEALAKLPGQLQAVFEKGHHTFETEHLRKDGTVFPVQCDITAVKDAGGEVAYLVINAQDLTERLELEAQLLQAQKMESVGRLAAGIAHDFNNYLSVINGYGEMLLSDARLDSSCRQQIQNIYDAGSKAAVITRQLLAFSRKQVLETRPQSLSGIVQDILKILDKMVGEDVRIHPKLESAGTAMLDRSQIEQAIMNLVVNARDAMPQGGALFIETKDVHVSGHSTASHAEVEPGDYLMLSVTDTGEGIPKEVMEKIFEPFFTTKELGRGTGLGLATVHGVVKQHRGHIYVYSEPGSGTTFKLYFPSTDKAAEAAAEVEQQPFSGGSRRVLIVDDDTAIRHLISDILSPLGFRCHVAANGKEALAMAGNLSAPPDLLITDVVMPGMNGRDLAAVLRMKFPACRVLFISGYTENVIAHRGIIDRDVPYLAKPITPQTLIQKVRDVFAEEKPEEA